jgi:hypothetical protein
VTRPAPAECAVCGAPIPPRAAACPECGADERTGWRDQDPYDGLDLPDHAFTDDDTAAFSTPRHSRPRPGLAWYWYATGLLALLCLLFVVLGLA